MNMKKIISSLAALFVLSIFCMNVFAQESVNLKYNYKVGKAYLTNSTVNTITKQTVMGQEMTVTADVKMENTMRVTKSNPDGSGSMLLSIKGNTTMNVPGMPAPQSQEIKIDSVQSVFAANGKTISTEAPDKNRAVTNGVTEYIKLAVLPGKDVKIGESWQDKTVDSVKTPEGGSNPMKEIVTSSNITSTLVGKEVKDGKNVYRISFQGSVEISGKGNQMGMDMTMEGAGETKGYYLFDPSISMIIYVENVVELNSNINVSGQQNMTIPMTQTVKNVSSTVTL